jgi:large exoprotein involved in heme utilization and adhesion
MTAEASQASGGEITITAPEMVRLTNSRISTSVFGGTGSGGNIKIDPQFVILQNSQIIANAVAGRGGNITIDFGVFLVDPNSVWLRLVNSASAARSRTLVDS